MIVTIVTPTLNGMRYLRECVESIRSQETADITIEHIIVDGGSTDGTPEFARSQGCTVITREEPSLFAAINKGWSHSSGTLLGSLACDDIMLSGAVADVVRHYERTGARWLIGGCEWLNERGFRGAIKAPPHWLSAPMLASLGWNCVPQPATFLRHDLVKETGGFDGRFMYSGDYDFFARLLERREPFVRIGRPLSAWRIHGANNSRTAGNAEVEWVRDRYGPASTWRQMLYRYLLKVWLNGTSPKWFALKRVDAVRSRLGVSPSA